MGKYTLITWCDSTVNSTTGCDGCELWSVSAGRPKADGPCYAGTLHEDRLAKALPALYAPDFTEVRLAPGRMAKAAAWSDLRGTARPDKPWLDGRPRAIFIGDMGDVLSKAVPFVYLFDEIMMTVASGKGSRHVWMLLTKRPQRLAEFARWCHKEYGWGWPSNLWVGTSVTTPKTLVRLAYLKDVPAAVRFVSIEPQRAEVNVRPWLSSLSLVIQGGESRQGDHEPHPFDVAWARRMCDDCRAAGVPYHLKQLGARPLWEERDRAPGIDPGVGRRLWRVPCLDRSGSDPADWPEDLRDCREWPEVAHA